MGKLHFPGLLAQILILVNYCRRWWCIQKQGQSAAEPRSPRECRSPSSPGFPHPSALLLESFRRDRTVSRVLPPHVTDRTAGRHRGGQTSAPWAINTAQRVTHCALIPCAQPPPSDPAPSSSSEHERENFCFPVGLTPRRPLAVTRIYATLLQNCLVHVSHTPGSRGQGSRFPFLKDFTATYPSVIPSLV